jgi:acetyl esterase
MRPPPAILGLALAIGLALPAAAADRWIPPAEARLTPEVRKVLADVDAGPSVNVMGLPPAERRAAHEAFFKPLGLPPADLTQVDERTMPGPGGPLRIRIYTPRGAHAGPRPIMTYYHGGGMSVGSLEQYDSLCQRLAARSGAILVAVDYRLTPEHRFPEPLDDAYAGLVWTYANAAALGGDPARLAVGGDSAGGNLAAVVAQKARDEAGPPLVFQMLLYPAVGYGGKSRSVVLFEHGYLFAAGELDMAIEQYADPEQRKSPRVFPILATDLSRLPPAFVLSAEYEVMRDDIEDYGARLRAAGVPVELKRYRGMIHPFLSMAGVVPQGRAALDDAADALRRATAPPRP